MSTFEARQWDPTVMFIPNMTEKVFPRYHPQDPLLPDSAVRQLKAAGVRLRESRDRDEEEASLFDSLALRPREICLSYPRRNARGDENLRSSFFSRIRAAESKAVPVRPAPASPLISLRPIVPVRSADLLAYIAERNQYFTPSSLETYARCPFQFFANRTLKLESLPDSPEERLNFLAQGTIVHDVLKEWTGIRGEVAPIFAGVFKRVCEELHIQRTYRTEVLRQRMLMDLETFCSTFQTYGDGDCLAERKFEFEILPGVRLKGRIDRVDVTASGRAVIIDYKYSNNTKQNVEDETKLQGVLYTIAAERELKLKPQATVFLGVKRENRPAGWGHLPGYNLLPITADWLQKGLDAVERFTREIREGRVEAHPSAQKHCVYCDFRDACRYERSADFSLSSSWDGL
jgi:ATP-dependent helicase/DNAse subunit B